MKKLLLLLWATLLLVAAFGYPVRIQSWNLDKDIKTINALHISIDCVNRSNGTIIAYVRDHQEHDRLLAAGFDAQTIPNSVPKDNNMPSSKSGNPKESLNYYLSLADYQDFMETKSLLYPDICQLYEFGNSVNNHPLYFMKISDNVNINEAEPEVKLIASMHGDETVGYIMMLRLIEYLTEGYNIDPRISDIVNNTELWICPLMNPDGYENETRYNAVGVDLNRNFPTPSGATNPDGFPHAPETIAMMDFSSEHNFVSGINFHGGMLVINYPWDYTISPALDNDLLIDMSLTYSSHNMPMYNSTEFDQGITNGATWYIVQGSMQDWNYAYTSNIELTAEISYVKWPPANTLDGFWEDNCESVLSYIEYAQKGVKGIITNFSGEAIPAVIRVSDAGKDITNDPIVGDYHRILMPGSYTLEVSSQGYLPQTVDITVPPTGFTTCNISLEQAEWMTFAGIVRNSDGYPIPNATVKILSEPLLSAQANVEGSFIFPNLLEGHYLLQIDNSDNPPFYTPVRLRKSTLGGNVSIVLSEALFFDDFESDLNNWTGDTNWALLFDSNNGVLSDSPSGNYGNNWNKEIHLQNPISLQNVQNPILSFKAKWNLEEGYDFVYVEVSTDGTNWSELTSFTGQALSWTNQVFNLDNFVGSNLHLRFRLHSDWFENEDGIYIDDLVVSGSNNANILFGDADGDGVITSMDVSSVLDHCVGNYLEVENMPGADVDQTDGIRAIDAYQIYLYTQDPNFRFPAQTQIPFDLPEPELSYSVSEDPESEYRLLNFNIADPSLIHSQYWEFPFPVSYAYSYFIDTAFMEVEHMGEGKYSRIDVISPAQLSFRIHSEAEEFIVLTEINGHLSAITVEAASINEIQAPQANTMLYQNYPNPFNPNTQIRFSLPVGSLITLSIYNTKGQLVKKILDTYKAAGVHTANWDGKDEHNQLVSSGIYYYQLITPLGTINKKMVLSK